MSDFSVRGLIQIGISVLSTTVSESEISRRIYAFLGEVTAKNARAEVERAEWWQHVGIASRPSEPEPGKEAARVIIVRQGGQDAVIASQDPRGQKLYGQLEPGETSIYAAGKDGKGQSRLLLKANGAVALYAIEGNSEGGNSVTVQLLPSGEIHIASSLGGISIIDGKLTILSGAGAGIQCSSAGVALNGQTIQANGSVVLGGEGATGVATQTSLTPFMLALNAFAAAFATFASSPIGGLSAGTAAPVAAALTALAALGIVPTTYSLTVKST